MIYEVSEGRKLLNEGWTLIEVQGIFSMKLGRKSRRIFRPTALDLLANYV